MALAKMHAPKCAMPECTKSVGYHKSYIKLDGTRGYKHKTFCEYHRKDVIGKAAKQLFLNSKGGCENKDGRVGFVCGDPKTSSLTIDHWDGDKYNNHEDNLVVLCANCHNEKTKRAGDTLQRYTLTPETYYELFEEQE